MSKKISRAAETAGHRNIRGSTGLQARDLRNTRALQPAPRSKPRDAANARPGMGSYYSDLAMLELLHEWGILRDHNLLRDLAIVFTVSFAFFVWYLHPDRQNRQPGTRRPRRQGSA